MLDPDERQLGCAQMIRTSWRRPSMTPATTACIFSASAAPASWRLIPELTVTKGILAQPSNTSTRLTRRRSSLGRASFKAPKTASERSESTTKPRWLISTDEDQSQTSRTPCCCRNVDPLPAPGIPYGRFEGALVSSVGAVADTTRRPGCGPWRRDWNIRKHRRGCGLKVSMKLPDSGLRSTGSDRRRRSSHDDADLRGPLAGVGVGQPLESSDTALTALILGCFTPESALGVCVAEFEPAPRERSLSVDEMPAVRRDRPASTPPPATGRHRPVDVLGREYRHLETVHETSSCPPLVCLEGR